MMLNKKILITGGAGFIGSYVNKTLLKLGYKTIVLDNLSRGYRHLTLQGEFIHGGIEEKHLVQQILKEESILAVMHFAAYTDVGESVKNPSLYYLNNVSHTLSLLETIVQHSPCPFIFSSSAAVYGHPLQNHINEEHPCKPINPYGETKWMVEKILRDFDQAYGLKYCALRYFNAAGGDPEGKINHAQLKSHNLIPIILKGLKHSSAPLTIYGTDYPTLDGTCTRDYIHIDDLAQAHISALERLLNGGKSDFYNLGNGRGFSIHEVISAVETTLNKKVNYTKGPRRDGDPAVLLADYSKAKKELNWTPTYGLPEMIAHAWNGIGSAHA
jgi:UDP-glucose 4-epimerase